MPIGKCIKKWGTVSLLRLNSLPGRELCLIGAYILYEWSLRSKVMALLAEVPGGKLQLFKFREMYEKRYHDSIGVSDLYKMKDVSINEEQSGTFFTQNQFL